MKKLIRFILDSEYRFSAMSEKGWLNWIPDSVFLKIKYKKIFGKKLNLKSPKTFNEKMQWLKLHDRNPIYIKIVDKYEAKKLIADKIGDEYIIPTLGVWDRFDDIDFDTLPSSFVLKCTHDSGSVVVCKDKANFDFAGAKDTIERGLKRNFYSHGREWPYKHIKPRIIAETLLHGEMCDYKFMCYGGKVKNIFTCTERKSKIGLKVTFFDAEWNRLPFIRHYPASETTIAKPTRFDEMKALAEKLSEGTRFERVDLYEVDGKIYFGEITFYPGSGFEEFHPEEWDEKIGDLIDLE